VKRRVLAIGMLAVALGALFLGARSTTVGGATDLFDLRAASMSSAETLLSFDGNTGWLNTPPLTAADLRGKVVLVDFWTYTCINWRRTSPYVRAWAEKYRDKGLVVVGVHTPEFTFERDLRNVTQAVKDIGVPYPVAVDSDYRIWRAYENEYWPNVFLIDAKGRMRYTYPGEGQYDRTERMIQQLLSEAGATGVPGDLVKPQGTGAEAPPDFADLQTPETYLGYGRGQSNANDGAAGDNKHSYVPPSSLKVDMWALSGNWTIARELAMANEAGSAVRFAFHARDVHLVMGPSSTQPTPIRFRVRLDGRKPGADHGVDVDENGEGTLAAPRMYHLIRQQGAVSDRRIEIEFLDPGAQAYVFTFG
jgi:thiol-disulfide isomerase/thioredoxin